jgi:hypothetical protein
MSAFFVVRVSGSMTVVDSCSTRRGVRSWRIWFPVSPASLNRLRFLYKSCPRKVYVFKGEFSKARLAALRSAACRSARGAASPSLDYLQTSGPSHENLQ